MRCYSCGDQWDPSVYDKLPSVHRRFHGLGSGLQPRSLDAANQPMSGSPVM